MANLLLHIGSGKAGSTSLQAWLRKQNPKLLGHGVHFLECLGNTNQTVLPCYAAESGRNLRIKQRLGIGRPEIPEFRERVERDLRAEVMRLAGQVDWFVASSENLFLDLGSRAEVRRLAGFLNAVFDEVKVVLFLRRQDRFAVSQYNDAVKRYFCYERDPFQYIEDSKFRDFVDYERKLRPWEYIFGREALIVRGDVDAVEEFSAIASLGDVAAASEMPRENVALAPEAMEILRRLNAVVGKEERLARIVARLHARLASCARGPGMLPAKAEAERFYANFESSNAQLASNYGRDGRPFFREAFDNYPDKADIERIREADIRRLLKRGGVRAALADAMIHGVVD